MIEIFKKYSNFERTATRSEYWGVFLSTMALAFVVGIIGAVFMVIGTVGIVFGALVILAAVVISLWINIATIMARCRDAGINPWFTLACFIPYIGWIVVIVIGCLESKE
jgi:uncharacterized membrane protein YhaH (DUF805 family)